VRYRIRPTKGKKGRERGEKKKKEKGGVISKAKSPKIKWGFEMDTLFFFLSFFSRWTPPKNSFCLRVGLRKTKRGGREKE